MSLLNVIKITVTISHAWYFSGSIFCNFARLFWCSACRRLLFEIWFSQIDHNWSFQL